MRHRQSGRHLGRDTSHRRALYRNLITDLLRHERITTTEAKAKEIRPMAEKMVTLAKRGDVHARRQALKFIYDTGVVKHLFDNIGPRMANRPGGYLRITKLEPRKGDAASMAAIEFVDYWGAASMPAAPAARRPAPAAAATTAPPAKDAPAAGPLDESEVVEMMTDESEDGVTVDEEAMELEAAAEEAAEARAEAAVEAAAEEDAEAEAAADEPAVADAQAEDQAEEDGEPEDESDDKS